MKAFIVDRYGKKTACGLAKCQTRSCERMTCWSRFTPLL